MILSVSRRTDIPCYYFDWFLNRLNEGYVYVRNPINKNQVSYIEFDNKVLDFMVFWTKYPINILNKIENIKDYNFYIQYTITGYEREIEPFCHSKDNVIDLFKDLSLKVGKERILLRYDPIFISKKYNLNFHVNFFEYLCKNLRGYTNIVVISFLDLYKKIIKNIEKNGIRTLNKNEIEFICERISKIAKNNNMKVQTCSEKIDLSKFGIEHGSCIDKKLIEKITGFDIDVRKDKNQRKECGCIESIDIGCYDSCQNGCIYCYANQNNIVSAKKNLYNVNSPILCDCINENDIIKKREVKTFRCRQLKLF